jgi:Holliday junction resolvase-like predicted endonuclease
VDENDLLWQRLEALIGFSAPGTELHGAEFSHLAKEAAMSRQVGEIRGKSNVNVRDDEAELARASERYLTRLQEAARHWLRSVDRKRDLSVRMADVVLIVKRNQSASQARLRSTWRHARRGEIADCEVDPFRLAPARMFASNLRTERIATVASASSPWSGVIAFVRQDR